MALPGNVPSTSPQVADYLSPYNRYTGELEDFEAGPISLNDASQGLDVQIWHLIYNDAIDSPTYGDFTITAETTGETAVIINRPGVKRIGLAFNQNGDPFICYEDMYCGASYYYFDTVAAGYLTTLLPGGSYSVACCLDDHRTSQVGVSDTILGYIRGGTLYYRQERDRFLTERSLGPVGAATLHKVGMTTNARLKFEVYAGSGIRLSTIVGNICEYVDLKANQIDVEDLYPVLVRGFIVGQSYSGADTLRALQGVYFFDMPEIDGKLTAVPRGGEISKTVRLGDCVVGEEVTVETAREQGLEFPRKVHLMIAIAETSYAQTKVTSERRSPDIKAQSETSIDTAVNFEIDEAAERCDILHKVAWNEFEGKAKFGISEEYAQLVPSDLISLEVRPNVFRRYRLTRVNFADGVYECEAVRDRQSAYTSGAVGLLPISPEPPPPTLPGDTTWEYMDLPTLLTSFDALGLHAYVAGRGDPGTAWHGAQVQRLVGANFLKEVDITSAETMGLLVEALPWAPADYVDVTNTVLVSLNTPPEASISEDQFLKGGNAMLIGNEIIQYKDVVADGANWRMSYLARGRLNTTIVTHDIGTRVVALLNPTTMPLDVSLLNQTLTLRAPSFGQAGSEAPDAPYLFTGRSQREWAPVWLNAVQNGSDWSLSWMPRWRLGNAATPVKSMHFANWRIKITNGPTTVTKNMLDPEYLYTGAAQTLDFGAPIGTFDIEVMGVNNLTGEGDILSETI